MDRRRWIGGKTAQIALKELTAFPPRRPNSACRSLCGLILTAVTAATNAAYAQTFNDLLTIFGRDKQRAARQAQAEWRRLLPAEMACIDQRLRRKDSSVEALIRQIQGKAS
jgi:hypothetical protein